MNPTNQLVSVQENTFDSSELRMNPVGSKDIYHGILEELVVLPISYSITHQKSLSIIAQNKNYLNGAEYLWQRVQRKIQGYEQFFRNLKVGGDNLEIITDPYSAIPYIIIQKNVDCNRINSTRSTVFCPSSWEAGF